MRSKKMVILSHCILNVNSKVEGFDPYESIMRTFIDNLHNLDFGIIQLPCPELFLMGMRRWGVVKEQLSHEHAKNEMRKMLQPIIWQIQNYKDCGYKIYSIIGIDGSPSCGVNFTCKSKKWYGEFLSIHNFRELNSALSLENEKGIFMEIFSAELSKINESIPFLAINESEMETSIEQVTEELIHLSNKDF